MSSVVTVAKLAQLPCQPRMSIHAFLPGEAGKARCLRHIALVAWQQHDLEVEAAQPDEADDVVKAHRGAAGLPPRYPGLGGACQLGQLCLRQARASPRLTDQVTTHRGHEDSITVLLCYLDGDDLAGIMGAMADELDELYEVKPEEFTALRTKLVAAAEQRGDADTAKQ